MKDKVLIDTSVWVDFFRGKDSRLIEQVGGLLKAGKAVYTGIIALELINGAKGNKELQALHDAFDTMDKVNEQETTCVSAGKMGYEIARKGNTMSVVDLLIARIAIENDISLMTFDEHFKTIAKHSELRLI